MRTNNQKPLYKLFRSSSANKKWVVYVRTPHTGRIKQVSFGAKGYQDYTQHHDPERRRRYQIRHAKDRIHDPTSPGFWSYWVLWGPSTNIQTNVQIVKRHFRLQ